jgi:hypothetical protein
LNTKTVSPGAGLAVGEGLALVVGEGLAATQTLFAEQVDPMQVGLHATASLLRRIQFVFPLYVVSVHIEVPLCAPQAAFTTAVEQVVQSAVGVALQLGTCAIEVGVGIGVITPAGSQQVCVVFEEHCPPTIPP